MRTYAVDNELFTAPRRNLIGSYHAKGMVIATPYLQWLLKNGVKVTRLEWFVR